METEEEESEEMRRKEKERKGKRRKEKERNGRGEQGWKQNVGEDGVSYSRQEFFYQKFSSVYYVQADIMRLDRQKLHK